MENIFALLKQGSLAYQQTSSIAGKLPFTSIAPVTEVLPNGQVSVAASEYGGLSTTPPLYRACPTFGMTFPAPRVGDTVVYSYLDGDPNQGVYWGHLQNNLNLPAANQSAFTYTLGENTIVYDADGMGIQVGTNTITVSPVKITLKSGDATFEIEGTTLSLNGFTSVKINGKEVATVGARTPMSQITYKGWV